jgi:RNA polymerase sigma-70 factor, ECF subfamily
MIRWASPDLVARALNGNPEGIEQLIAAVWPRCFRLAASIIGDVSLAQDAAQEACAIVYRKVRSLRAVDAFDAWLYRIVMREAIRVRKRNPAPNDLYAEPYVHDATAAIDVWRAIATLSPELRDVTVLFYLDDLKSDEIAAILHVPHATVRTRLLRARERLRVLLGDYAGAVPSSLKEVQHRAV